MTETIKNVSDWLKSPVGDIWKLPVSWVLRQRGGISREMAEELGVDRLLLLLLKNRGMETTEEMKRFLFGGLSDLLEPSLLPDMEKAAEIIRAALESGRAVRIIGDYDVDGITASFVLYQSFLMLYPENGKGISVRIPDRITDGYGLGQRLIEEAVADGVELLVTCDNGIAAMEPIRLAKEQGMTVVVTDHHEPHYEDADGEKRQLLPCADAVVDPKRYDSAYPAPEICGAVVAFKLCQLLWDIPNRDLAALTEQAGQNPKGRLVSELLQACGLATVCDVMPLIGENRIFTRIGLSLMERTNNPGLLQLILQKDLADKPLTAYHMGFLIGPCLNSSGRLESAMTGFSLLCEKDEEEAERIALQLVELNEERKRMTEQAVAMGICELEKREKASFVIVVYLPQCHESLAGIVAGKLRERYDRPAIVLTDANEPGMLKGSARSTGWYDISRGLHRAQDLLAGFGGHKLAAGMTLLKENLKAFEARLNEDPEIDPSMMKREILLDCNMPFSYISEQLIGQLSLLEPCGTGNRRPLFGRRDVNVCSPVRIMGKDRNVAKCILSDESGMRIDAICFQNAGRFAEDAENTGRLHILYRPQINEYLSQKTLQVVIEDWAVAGD
ncbi:MAG: single-stranded-DNA-specific exonuclease RecJ [Lachnospiraceae bacterium]|nr:single-stranded-DNA-specific exonuclease RecJ [Lachnospiraceae bacterium]